MGRSGFSNSVEWDPEKNYRLQLCTYIYVYIYIHIYIYIYREREREREREWEWEWEREMRNELQLNFLVVDENNYDKSNSRYIHTKIGGKVHRLTKTLSWNMTKWGLFFYIVFLAVHTVVPSVLLCLDPIGKKRSSTVDMKSSYELFSLSTFLSTLVRIYIHCSIFINMAFEKPLLKKINVSFIVSFCLVKSSFHSRYYLNVLCTSLDYSITSCIVLI